MLRLSLLTCWLLTLLAKDAKCKAVNTETWRDAAVAKLLTKRVLECPDLKDTEAVETPSGHFRKQSLSDSHLVLLKKMMLTFKIHELVSKGVCDDIEIFKMAAKMEAVTQRIEESGHKGSSDVSSDSGFFGEVSTSLQELDHKVDELTDFLDTGEILLRIRTTKQYLKSLQIAQDLGLIEEQELDDILDWIKDFIDDIDDFVDRVCDYLERIGDDIWDWIDDMPVEDLEKLFKFLHFWIQNVEIPCDGSGTIIICDVEYHIHDIINCCIMG